MSVSSINPIMTLFGGSANAVQEATNSGLHNTGKSPNNNDLGIQDFFTLMAAQLKNQSMYDEVDNTQFITQMAQFSTLSMISELNNSMQTNLAVAMIGKNVCISTIDRSGIEQVVVGQVEQVSIIDKVPNVLVDGSFYPITDVTDIG